MRGAERWVTGSVAWALAALVSACAGVPRDPSLPIDDPYEQFNRSILRANQVVLDPVANVVKAGRPRPAQPPARFGRQPQRAAHFRQRHPARPLGTRPASRSNASCSIRSSVLAALSTSPPRAGFRSRPAILAKPCSSGASPRAPMSSGPISAPRRRAIRSAAPWIRRSTRSAGRWARRHSAGRGPSARRALEADGPSWPMEGGRERLDRLLQLPALGLLPDPPGGAARGAWPAAPHRVAGHRASPVGEAERARFGLPFAAKADAGQP